MRTEEAEEIETLLRSIAPARLTTCPPLISTESPPKVGHSLLTKAAWVALTLRSSSSQSAFVAVKNEESSVGARET